MKPAVHQFEDKLLDFAYGELPPPEAAAVDAHVRGCAKCAQALAEMGSVRTAMRALPSEPAPDAGLESLLAYAEQQAKRNAAPPVVVPWWRRLLVPVSSAMALTIVAVIALRVDAVPDTSTTLRKAEPVAAVAAAAPVVAAPPPASNEVAEAAPLEPSAIAAVGAKQGDVDALAGSSYRDAEDKIAKLEKKSIASALKDSTARLDNYSNSGSGLLREERDRAKEQEVAQAPVEEKARANSKTDAPFGLAVNLGTGTSMNGPLTKDSKRPAPAAAAPELGAVAQAPSVAEVGGGNRSRAGQTQAPAAEPSSTAPPPPEPEQQSLALNFNAKNKVGAASTYADGASKGASRKLEAAEDDFDKVGEDRRQAASSVVGKVESQVMQARAANARGDADAEIKEYLAVLRGGAQGAPRAEALKRLCEAYEARGEPDRARPYCELLARDFGQTPAKPQLPDRRVSEQYDEAQKVVAPKKGKLRATEPAVKK